MRYLCFLLLIVCGCDFNDIHFSTPAKPIFSNVYDVLSSQPNHSMKSTAAGSVSRRATVSVIDMPLSRFLSWVSTTYNITVICSSECDSKLVSISVNDDTLDTVLSLISRRLGVDVTRVGNTYYIGRLTGADRGLLVRRVSRLNAKELELCLSTVLSDIGKIATFDDGLMVIGDKIDVLEKINKLIDDIQSQIGDVWVLQLYLISITHRASIELGIDATPSADISLSFAVASRESSGNVVLNTNFSALLKATAENSGVNVVASPLFLLLDGGTGHFGNGQSIPIAKKTVSSEGTVTTTSYDYVDTGLQINVDLRSVGNNQSRITLDLIMSDVVGYVGDAPIKDERKFKGSSIISSGGIYLLGSLQSQSKSKSVGGVLPLSFSDDNQSIDIQLWARTYRVGGPVNLK